MTKRPDAPQATPPSISPADGKRRFEHMRDKAKEMKATGSVSDEAANTWANTTLGYIKQTFGSDTPHVFTFLGQMQVRMGGNEHYYEVQNARDMQKRISVLDDPIYSYIDCASLNRSLFESAVNCLEHFH